MKIWKTSNRGGSNWAFEKVLFLEIHFARWNPLRGSGWIALPPALQKKKALINMKNEDDMCFKWCLARAVNPVQIQPGKNHATTARTSRRIKLGRMQIPHAVNKIKLFESRNPNISVNVFGWTESRLNGFFPLKIVREEKEKSRGFVAAENSFRFGEKCLSLAFLPSCAQWAKVFLQKMSEFISQSRKPGETSSTLQ